MNPYYIIAGALLAVAFVVHLFRGNRTYSAACPATTDGAAYTAWLLGRCGFSLIAVDLALSALFASLFGWGVISRNRLLEIFLAATYGCWTFGWLATLIAERAAGYFYRRLYHWILFFVVTALLVAGLLGD